MRISIISKAELNLEFVEGGLSRLLFVEISLNKGKDDPQRIFESLNSTGLELSQADLIRNYILMGLKQKDQSYIYKHYWKIIEKNAREEKSNKSKVSDFIRDYLTSKNSKIPNKSKVYIEFKDSFPPTDRKEIENYLTPIKSLSLFYNKLLNPENEPEREIQTQIKYINRIEINVAYPFLIKVYRDYAQKVIEKSTFIDLLELIQSFVWRRFIADIPTASLNRIFMTLYGRVDKKNYLGSIQSWLSKKTGAYRLSKDKEVIESLKTKNVYNLTPRKHTYLLERLENFENREPVQIEDNPDITIEHILPPTSRFHLETGFRRGAVQLTQREIKHDREPHLIREQWKTGE